MRARAGSSNLLALTVTVVVDPIPVVALHGDGAGVPVVLAGLLGLELPSSGRPLTAWSTYRASRPGIWMS